MAHFGIYIEKHKNKINPRPRTRQGREGESQVIGGPKQMGFKGLFESGRGFTMTDVEGGLVPERGRVE